MVEWPLEFATRTPPLVSHLSGSYFPVSSEHKGSPFAFMEYRKTRAQYGNLQTLVSHMSHELVFTTRVMENRIYSENVNDTIYLVGDPW